MRSIVFTTRRRDSGKPSRCKALMLGLALLAWGFPALAATPQIAVSIRPLHALVAGVMEGVGTPALIVSGNQSPHEFSLRPSQGRLIAHADIIFLINRDFELFLQKPLQNATRTQAVEVSDAKGIVLYPSRQAHADTHGVMDYHIWLDPPYAAAIVQYVADILTAKDPEHANTYKNNAAHMISSLTALDKEVAVQLRHINTDTMSYLAYHDAYQYFERHYNLPQTPVIIRNPEAGLGAKSFSALQANMHQRPPHCIFSEPQFDASMVQRLAREYGAEVRVLNPDGSTFGDGKQAYFALIKDIARNFAECSHVEK